MVKIVSFILTLFSGLIGCNDKASQATSTQQVPNKDTLVATVVKPEIHNFPYELNEPDATFKLDKNLEEISGLGIDAVGKFLYAVQDEKGLVFKLDKSTGEIVDKIKFHKDGDYEGIELVGDKVYVVKSTGTIYEIKNLGDKNQEMKKYNSFLSRENDVEGLAFDAENNRLLVACKGIPATGESFEVMRYKKVIYAYDIETSTLSPDPIYTIQLDNIRKYLDQHTTLKEYEKLLEFFSAGKENLTFNPSAIAVHPISNKIYIISSSGKVLIVLDPSGDIIHIEKLKKSIHAQPEGIVFDSDGTLYISNEAKGKKPKIHRFDVKATSK